jgi:chromate transport protein ChrA
MAILAAWLTLAVYAAGVAMILVAFAYRYRPSPWLRVVAQGAVVAALALVLASAIVAWREHSRAPPPTPPPTTACRPNLPA